MNKLNKIGKLFPSQNETVAFYDPATFYIHLGTISQEEFNQTRLEPFSHENIENLKIIFHEIRHNVDHIATLWGQKNILKYLKALNARLNNNPEQFYSIIDHMLEDNQLFFAAEFHDCAF